MRKSYRASYYKLHALSSLVNCSASFIWKLCCQWLGALISIWCHQLAWGVWMLRSSFHTTNLICYFTTNLAGLHLKKLCISSSAFLHLIVMPLNLLIGYRIEMVSMELLCSKFIFLTGIFYWLVPGFTTQCSCGALDDRPFASCM